MWIEPSATIHYLHVLGLAYFFAGRYETAAALCGEQVAVGLDTYRLLAEDLLSPRLPLQASIAMDDLAPHLFTLKEDRLVEVRHA